jgi:AraC family transcriptional regulator, transcriptional activator of pobA
MPPSPLTQPNGSALVAAQVDAAFAHRTWSIGAQGGRGRFHIFLVTRGTAQLAVANSQALELAAPFILWLARTTSGEFRLMAGGEGFTISVAEEFVWRAASDSPVALHLRPLFDRTIAAAAERVTPRLAELRVSFKALVRESRDAQPGSIAVCAAHLTLLLVHLWRAADLANSSASRGTASGTAQRFRQLVELHFRENVRINDYARKLGVTRAHLHEACLRATTRTPLAIVHERLIEEAQLRLEQTELPVEQVGYSLGFRDPAYFNRFFKKRTGRTPAAFRTSIATTPPRDAAARSFAAWP